MHWTNLTSVVMISYSHTAANWTNSSTSWYLMNLIRIASWLLTSLSVALRVWRAKCYTCIVISIFSATNSDFRHKKLSIHSLNPLYHSGYYTIRFNCIKSSSFSPQIAYGFLTILRISTEYFPKQHLQLGFYSGDVVCFLGGTNWIYK
jgi:hypothetical protein